MLNSDEKTTVTATTPRSREEINREILEIKGLIEGFALWFYAYELEANDNNQSNLSMVFDIAIDKASRLADELWDMME